MEITNEAKEQADQIAVKVLTAVLTDKNQSKPSVLLMAELIAEALASARAAEREICAKIVEHAGERDEPWYFTADDVVELAAAIRARGEKQ